MSSEHSVASKHEQGGRASAFRSTPSAYSQTSTWLGFVTCNAVTRPVVHFFPSAGNVTAPYAATCKLTLFGGGVDAKSVNLEGARLSHPDGVRLEEVFPQIAGSTNSLFGIEIEMGTSQQRVDLSGSSCILEFVSGGQSVKFLPQNLAPSQTPGAIGRHSLSMTPAPTPPMVLRDGFQSTSLVAVNGDKDSWSPTLALTTRAGDQPISLSLPAGIVAPGHVCEIPIADGIFEQLPATECTWGLVRAAPLEVGERRPLSALFLLYRDASTRRPISIRAI